MKSSSLFQDPPALDRLLARVRVVLVAPSHPGNVGSVARAMAVVGLRQLWLAEPVGSLTRDDAPVGRAMLDHPEARALAAGAEPLLDDACAGPLAEALAPCQVAVGFTARPREFEPVRLAFQEAVSHMARTLASTADEPSPPSVALVFGSERAGLSNLELASCSHVCGFDVNPGYSSLNLAQAVQLASHRLRESCREVSSLPPPVFSTEGHGRPTARPALQGAVLGLQDHLLRLAERSGQLDPQHPGRMAERLGRLLSRSGLLEDEVQMLRGLCTALERQLDAGIPGGQDPT